MHQEVSNVVVQRLQDELLAYIRLAHALPKSEGSAPRQTVHTEEERGTLPYRNLIAPPISQTSYLSITFAVTSLE